MLKELVFHEDVFYSYFQPFRHPQAQFNFWGGLGLETFGKDFHTAQSADAHCLWTVLDGETGNDLWIVPGLHTVNRICYLLTHMPHHEAPIAFRVEGKPRPITRRGLACRMTTLKRVMHAHRQNLRLAY